MVLRTRERIVQAAEKVMRDRGPGRATTKEIARAAGCSEALLYKHFTRKEEIILAVILERMPLLASALGRLHAKVGEHSVTANLTEFARAALEFYRRSLPYAGGVATEPALLEGFRAMLSGTGFGPHIPVVSLADYLTKEQGIGRVSERAVPDAAAAMLIGACYHRAFLTAVSDLGPD